MSLLFSPSVFNKMIALRIVPSFPLCKPAVFPGRGGRVTDFSAEGDSSMGCLFATSVVNMDRPFYAVR